MTTLKSRVTLSAVACLLLMSAPSEALILTGKGNSPVRDRNWRAGAVDVANLKCRVGWWEGPPFGGGMWNFLYRGDTDTFNKALEAFATVRAPSLELIVCDGPAESVFLKDDKDPKSNARYDWDFVIWVASIPPNMTFPEVGSISLRIARPVVVLPHPLSPTSPIVSPFFRVKEIPSTAYT